METKRKNNRQACLWGYNHLQASQLADIEGVFPLAGAKRGGA